MSSNGLAFAFGPGYRGHGHLACERIKGDRRIDLIRRSRFAFS